LKTRMASPHRSCWGLSTLAFLLVWGAFALGGAVDASEPSASAHCSWPATEEAVQEHAAMIYLRVTAHAPADVNGDGELTYLEKDTYLVALAMRTSEAFGEEFPYADRNHSGNLDIIEAYDAIRGVTLVAYADRRPGAPDWELDYEFCHMALAAQEWLLDNPPAGPSPAELDNIWSVLKRIHPPRESFSARMLDHGGPEPSEQQGKGCGMSRSRFQELDGNIADVEARLAEATDSAEIARLERMLARLQGIMAKLQAE